MSAEADNATHPESPAPAEPDSREVIEALYDRLGEDGVRQAVTACLRAVNRARAIEVINENLGTVRLASSADRGRMGRLLVEGLQRRRGPVLDVLQTLSRDLFDERADSGARERLDQAVDDLNAARGPASEGEEEKKRKAAGQVAAVLSDVLKPEEARRLILFNAFPDTIDVILAAAGESSES
jgi:hypothetical protein